MNVVAPSAAPYNTLAQTTALTVAYAALLASCVVSVVWPSHMTGLGVGAATVFVDALLLSPLWCGKLLLVWLARQYAWSMRYELWVLWTSMLVTERLSLAEFHMSSLCGWIVLMFASMLYGSHETMFHTFVSSMSFPFCFAKMVANLRANTIWGQCA